MKRPKILAVMVDTEKRLTDGEAWSRVPAFADNLLHVTDYRWSNSFADLRNYALMVAMERGANWALRLDTDMHYTEREDDLASKLIRTEAVSVSLNELRGEYTYPMLIRLPPAGKYVGRTHEYYDTGDQPRIMLDWPRFWEDSKSPEQMAAKRERDLTLLKTMLAEDRTNARWWYYLGDAYQGLNDYPQAEAAFVRAATYSEWDEERGWSWYRIACLRHEQERPASALQACLHGLAEHAGIGELAWLAGLCCYALGKMAQCERWERIAITINRLANTSPAYFRTGFTNPPARYEGPFDVLRSMAEIMGDKVRQSAYEHAFRKEQLKRRLDMGHE